MIELLGDWLSPSYKDMTVREITNGQRFLMTLPFLFLLLSLASARMSETGILRFFFTKHDWGMQVIQAMILLMTAETMRSGWIWAYLWATDRGIDLWIARYAHIWLSLSAALTVWGLICALRVFSFYRWSPLVWISLSAFAVLLPIALRFV